MATKQPGKIYVCADCADRLGQAVDKSKPHMWHICEICGDGRKDLFELDKAGVYGFIEEDKEKEQPPAEECK